MKEDIVFVAGVAVFAAGLALIFVPLALLFIGAIAVGVPLTRELRRPKR